MWDSYPWNASSSSGYDAAMADEVARLSDEVARFEEEQQSPSRLSVAVPSPKPGAEEEPVQLTSLVFRSKRTEEVQNYAIVGQTLWIFNPPRARRIPLSELDLTATAKLNDERGVDFRLPR
jgi:hypothetical protein